VWNYELLGLGVRSELRLDAEESLTPLSLGYDRCEVRLERETDARAFAGSELVARLGSGADGYEIRRSSGVLLAQFGDHTRLAIDVAAGVLHASGDPAALPYVIPNAGLSLYLVARKHLMLHASAVEHGGRAHALLGPSHSGKTTLAALLCAAGATLFSDDTLRVRVAPPVVVWGGTRSLRLRPSAVELAHALPGAARGLSRDGREVLVVPAPKASELGLASLWFPRPAREVTRPELVPVVPSAALERLLACTRLRGLTDRALLAEQFRDLGELARSVPAFEARVPWGPPFDARWGEALLQSVDAMRLGA